MSKPTEAEPSSAAPVDDPAQAWEECREAWLKPNEHGQRRATKATVDILEAVINSQHPDRASKAASERSMLPYIPLYNTDQ